MRPKLPRFGISKLELEKTFVIFEISTLEFVKMHKFLRNKKLLRPQKALFGYFWVVIVEKYCHIWNQQTRVFQDAKFRAKYKTSIIWVFLNWNLEKLL